MPIQVGGERKMVETFQPIFIDVAWIRDFETEPIRLVSGLDNDRYEVGKLEFYRDDRVGYADSLKSTWELSLKSSLSRH
jgi:hypothetical protein